jgi:hypothetical protein
MGVARRAWGRTFGSPGRFSMSRLLSSVTSPGLRAVRTWRRRGLPFGEPRGPGLAEAFLPLRRQPARGLGDNGDSHALGGTRASVMMYAGDRAIGDASNR